MRSFLGKLAVRVARRLGERPQRLQWGDAQAFELKHAIAFMDDPGFSEFVKRLDSPGAYSSKGARDVSILREFFAGDADLYDTFIKHITGKTVLDIGGCVFTPISFWDVASRRVIIEPLYEQVSQYQIQQLGRNCFLPHETAFAIPAERRVDELVGKVDGALLVRNCIDHSPQWAFILANIAAYMAPGAVLLIWNDLLHPPEYLDGHYDITDDALLFRQLLEGLGFRIEYEFELAEQGILNYGCRAVRV